MQCPKCHETLSMAERQGVEIDYCPKCRGVWLDRGELDKILERDAALEASAGAPSSHDRPAAPPYGGQGHYGGGHHHKHKSLLSQLFDI
ncbi:MAG: zf-TFIIB domain-containing protein [Nitrococcus sp.]|nr:zf-TFIIB domain-containing protein [Nitrococcus sp.]